MFQIYSAKRFEAAYIQHYAEQLETELNVIRGHIHLPVQYGDLPVSNGVDTL